MKALPLWLASLITTSLACTVCEASGYFLKLGEVTLNEAIYSRDFCSPQGEKLIPVEAWEWNSSSSSTLHSGDTGSLAAAKTSYEDLNLSISADISQVMPYLAQGELIRNDVVLYRCFAASEAGKSTIYPLITFRETLITSLKLGGFGDRRIEAVLTLNYAKFTVCSPIDLKVSPGGYLGAQDLTCFAWDVGKNKSFKTQQ